MEVILRPEKTSDYLAISKVIIDAYKNISYSNHKEQDMVERLRKSDSFIPQLSIVAEDEKGDLAGHILLTKINIQTSDQTYSALALAPLSVKTDFQNMGIGSKLVMESHRIAKSLGYDYIVVLGIANYYPKFGYEFTSKYNIKLPIKISEENALIISLTKNDFSQVTNGTVIYAEEFFTP